MHVSRRNFLCYVACLPAARLASALPETRAGARRSKPDVKASCLLLNSPCTLQESLEGYKRFLKAAGAPIALAFRDTDEPAPFILVPAASLTDLNQVRWLRRRIEAGATALVESGGAFLSLTDFRAQKRLVRSHFGIAMLQPVGLWEKASRFNRLPYVDFTWPVAARIRDFSRAIPLSGVNAQPIAIQENRIVGLKIRLGAGTLAFIGSPVGPHLLAGDRDAQRWFESFGVFYGRRTNNGIHSETAGEI